MSTGTVFNIQKFSINDGPGIRTAVFLKGCMLNCLWCHNPESKSARSELMLYGSKCVGCGECVAACPISLHSFSPTGEHLIARESCTACGACADACIGALQICGATMSTEEVIREVIKDAVYYKSSGGGLTVTGGEPFMQHGFALSLLKAAKERGINTAVETCGYVDPEILKQFVPFVDLFLWDVKETNEEKHKEYTGVSNRLILSNLRMLGGLGAQVVLRCPLIEGYNLREEHLINIGKLADELNAVIRVEIEPYHPLGRSKSEAMGKDYPLGEMDFLGGDKAEAAISTIARYTKKPVKRA